LVGGNCLVETRPGFPVLLELVDDEAGWAITGERLFIEEDFFKPIELLSLEPESANPATVLVGFLCVGDVQTALLAAFELLLL
jgi:hypothetical protein